MPATELGPRQLPRQKNARAKVLVAHSQMHDWLRKRHQYIPRTEISSCRRKQLLACFRSLDVDGSGLIDTGEIELVVSQLGLDVALVGELLHQGDDNGDGQLSFTEFMTLIARLGAQAQEMGSSVNAIVERAASFPLKVVANSRHIRELVDGYDPTLLDEMTGEVRKRSQELQLRTRAPKSGVASVADARPMGRAARPSGRAKQLRQQSRLLLDALQGVNPIESPLCSTTPTALAASSRSKSSNFASVPPRPSNTPTFGDELTQRLFATQRKFRTKVAWQLDEAAGSAPSVPDARPPGLMRRTSSHLLNMLASVSS